MNVDRETRQKLSQLHFFGKLLDVGRGTCLNYIKQSFRSPLPSTSSGNDTQPELVEGVGGVNGYAASYSVNTV